VVGRYRVAERDVQQLQGLQLPLDTFSLFGQKVSVPVDDGSYQLDNRVTRQLREAAQDEL
jgi:hypothetical protein